MSIKAGTYLGGVRDLEDLRQRCRIDADTGCWVWGLSAGHGVPAVVLLMPDGRYRSHRGKRAAALLAYGFDIKPGLIAGSNGKCSNPMCVNPAHIKLMTHAEKRKEVAAANLANPVLRAKLVETGRKEARRRFAKFDMETAEAIRRESGTIKEIAARYGMSWSNVQAIRAGRYWGTDAPNASVFSWKPAA